MTLQKLIGPATAIYIASATIACIWWASDLTRRVETIENSTVTAERLARLEAKLQALADVTHDLKQGVRELSRNISAR